MKWQKIHIYQQFKLKNKLSKREKQRQNHGYGEHFDDYPMEGVVGKWGRGEGIKKYK